MPPEPRAWRRATRVSNGGIHVYIPKELLERALEGATLPTDSKSLSVRAYGLRSDTPGSARIILKLVARDTEG